MLRNVRYDCRNRPVLIGRGKNCIFLVRFDRKNFRIMRNFSEVFFGEKLELLKLDITALDRIIAIDVPEDVNGVAARPEIDTATASGVCFFAVLDD
jgi:hypothetical protein